MTAAQKSFNKDYSYQAIRNRRKTLYIAEYLERIHGIEVPEDFSSQLLTAHQNSYRSSFNIHLKTIDAIVDACELFEEYVENINQLVCYEVITMVKIHTCIISKACVEKALIPVKESFPSSYKVIVKKNGSVSFTAKHSLNPKNPL